MAPHPLPDTRPWYQGVLPFGGLGGFYNTAADAVYRGLDRTKVTFLEVRFHGAADSLERRKELNRLFTAKYSFQDENGNTYICPLQLETLLDVLPDESAPQRRPENGGAPEIPFDAFLKAWILAPFYEVEDNSAALLGALARKSDYLVWCGFPGNDLPNVRSFNRRTNMPSSLRSGPSRGSGGRSAYLAMRSMASRSSAAISACRTVLFRLQGGPSSPRPGAAAPTRPGFQPTKGHDVASASTGSGGALSGSLFCPSGWTSLTGGQGRAPKLQVVTCPPPIPITRSP